MTRLKRSFRDELLRIIRYYFAGAINLFFGYILFVVLLWLGLQVFLAQALGYVIAVIFNYLTYSKIAFSDREGLKLSFLISYVANYGVSVLLLWILLLVITSPYIAGLFVAVGASLVNYFVLKKWVFRPRPHN